MDAEAVNVVIAEEYVDRFSEVVRMLASSGLRVTAVLPEFGIVSGSVFSAAIPTLRGVPGVVAVEPDRLVAAAL